MKNTVFDDILAYDHICIYRHVNPDFDAYGSQLGMAAIIKQLDPSKKVMLKGEINEELLSKMDHDFVLDTFDDVKGALAIVLDTANKERIDGEDVLDCDKIIKIDHHMIVDSYGVINIEYPTKSSTSQIVVELYKEAFDQKMNKEAATYLYFGMVADSNRFMYRNTDASTMMAAAYLMDCGIDIEDIYQKMYVRSVKDLEIQRFILNQYQSTSKGVAYYILKQEDLDELQISRSRGSDFVNMLSNIEEFEVWLAITQNIEKNNWRVSMRSRRVVINTIAEKYHGGGHQLASGATLNSIDELPSLIKDLEKAIAEVKE